jgi:D-methionine transport system substrate-binding protein
MGIYSYKLKTLDQIKTNASIAIPNDPSNGARALLLLQKAGLIELKATELPALADISANPKHLSIKELDAAQLPRILADVDAAVINTNFAIAADLRPSEDAIFLEGKDSPYVNLIVARKDNHKKVQLKDFIKAMNSKEVREKAKVLFGEGALPAW